MNPSIIIATFLVIVGCTWGQVLTPPYFNLAVGRRIKASATCGVGVSESELYCKLVGANTDSQDNPNINLIQGQVCDYCNPKSGDPETSHPPEYAIDGTERWWQSPPLSRGTQFNQVNLTIDLGQEYHVAYVFIRMANSPRPGIWALERSTDNGKTYKPWQYFADTESDCIYNFGEESVKPILEDDSVICETKFSKVVPLEGGEIVVSLLNDRPNANNFSQSKVLQEWTKATNIRLHLIRTKTLLGHLMSVARQDPTVTRRYFYSVKDISIGGRCVCNGHANTCDITDPQDPYKLLCRCQHNTCGPQCENCCPGFVQKKWQRATYISENECEPCNCFGHSEECVYDEKIDMQKLSIDMHGKYEGGGVCQNCRDNTEGVNCNKCKARFYRPEGRHVNATNVCEKCDCDYFYSTGSCAENTGKCECRPEFMAPDCDRCNIGYYGYPDCRPCDCNTNGTLGDVCENQGGNCPCKENFDGQNCDRCKNGYFGFPECNACDCDSTGSEDENCDIETGQCSCITNYGGRNCKRCAVGWFNYPQCEFCKCDSTGTLDQVCNNQTGECLCKEGFGSEQCDRCAPSYYGYPNCVECNCNEKGSSGLVCSASGQCPCLNNFSGQKCDQCSPGFHQYPECLPCNCDITGSIGISCNGEGTCTCKNNFDGENCNKCKEGFYNYPLCEECNCDPAGVLATFGGCGSLTDGLLCECKERVMGRICNKCKPLYWNMRANNPLGCDDCDCHQPGTIGGLRICSGMTGQCMCKPNVQSRRCDTCLDGTYQLRESNLFGCIKCSCNVGGSVNQNCDKVTGQCTCRPRVTGMSCDRPLKLHYFPTLYQLQFELEEGKTPDGTAVRYSYDQNIFPEFSWKGYAVFSQLQNEVLIEVEIDKPSLYHVILRYVNIQNRASKGEVRLIPDTSGETQQANSVIFAPSREAMLLRVSSPAGAPVPFVLNPGRWTISISADDVYIDYVVLLPSAFYEATLLHESVENPCTLRDTRKSCRRYKYPTIENFIVVRGDSGFSGGTGTQTKTQTYDNNALIDELNSGSLAFMNENQIDLRFNITLDKAGPYVFVITYHTSESTKNNMSANIEVELTGDKVHRGKSVLYNCKYNMLCRQAITDYEGRIAVIDTNSNLIDFKMTLVNGSDAVIHSVVAISQAEWSDEYLVPKSVCIQTETGCRNTSLYGTIPNSIKVEFETSEFRKVSKNQPDEIYDPDVKLIYLDKNETMVDIRGSVPEKGDYVFIVHYYQPNYPTFDVDVLIQNGQFYEATMPVPFCPSSTGCRSILQKKVDGNTNFNVLENFMLSINNGAEKGLWVDYVLVILAKDYSDKMLVEKFEDRAGKFISECSQDNFRMSLNASGYCRDSVFSLTAEYNNGALPCDCNIDGSLSFECDEFGGQCQCKPNVIGRKCSECETGFHGFPECKPCDCPSTAICHHITGKCICPSRVTGAKCDTCKPLTYGFDPIIGCQECNCNPLGVEKGMLQCDQDTGKCPCKPNVVGRKCEECAAGYWAFPLCRLCECDLRGTTDDICDQDNSRCHCKENVYGPACDKCKPGTFYLEERNPVGCTECFCFGTTNRCRSSLLFRIQIVDYNSWESIFLRMDAHNLLEDNDVNATIEAERGGILKASLPSEMPIGTFFYLVAPAPFLGNRITSYGGYLRYTIYFEVNETMPGGSVIGPDVILMGNNMTIMHKHLEQPFGGQAFSPEIPFLESEFTHLSGSPVTREQFMIILANVEGLYIRGLYYQPSDEVMISQIMLDTAEKGPIADAPQALEVESCQCPPNYRGSSCEECAPGYYRSKTGPHLGFCVPCQCNGHAETCDVNTGKCIDCKHDTTGDHCEMCIGGYYGDATVGTVYDCMICVCPLPYPSNNFAESCEISPTGDAISCQCKEGYYGPNCEVCAAGYYGRPDIIGGSCKPCDCSGNINATNPGSCDSQTGDCLQCLYNTAGTACNYCASGYYGDALINRNCQECDCNECGTEECDNELGVCKCQPNVVGPDCNSCAPEHWGFKSCLGCRECNCGKASYARQCSNETGQCDCKPGVTGLQCDICKPGFWNYTEEGCQHCHCDEIYSSNVACDPNTGRCQCLPGVIGDKCDHCPWRWVLITHQGCQECGSCIHSLLDESDSITNILDPALAELEGASTSFFAYKRLDHVNRTLHELRPRVDDMVNDPNKLDLTPLKDNITNLEAAAESTSTNGNLTFEKVVSIDGDAEKVKNDALDLEKLISEAIKRVFDIVDSIRNLAQGLNDEDAIADLDKFIAEAERILEEIKDRNNSAILTLAENENIYAFELFEKLQSFVIPAIENKAFAVKMKIKMERIDSLLADLKKQLNGAKETRQEVIAINEMNKKSVALTADEKLNENYKQTKEFVKNGDSNVTEASILLQNTLQAIEMSNRSSDELLSLTSQLEAFNANSLSQLNETEELVRSANEHAMSLGGQILVLKKLLDDTQITSKVAIDAATAYKGIVSAISDAKVHAEKAVNASTLAMDMSLGTADIAQKSLNVSVYLKRKAEDAGTKVEGDLWLSMKAAIISADGLASSISDSKDMLVMVEGNINALNGDARSIAETAIKSSTEANNKAMEAKSNIQTILEKLPSKEKEFETMKIDVENANDGIKRAVNLVERVPGNIPELKRLSKKLRMQRDGIKISNQNLDDRMAELRRKVALARDQAKRIDVGASMQGKTSIQLRNPENLQEAATYTQMSFYFKTKQKDGLITYVGNEVGTFSRLKRATTDDFMSVELNGGKIFMTIDLGSGPISLVNDKFVADDEWHKLEVERTGNSASLTVKTQDEKDSVSNIILRGNKIVFNLDQKESKFYVGGFPATAKIQADVQTRFFIGEIQELEFGKNFLGFWNYIRASGFGDGSRKRDKLVILEESTGMRFDGTGYAIIQADDEQMQQQASMFINFRTFSRNALMILVTNMKGNYLSLELNNGYVNFKFDLGDGIVKLTSPKRYNDGQWHRVELGCGGQQAILKVDFKTVADSEGTSANVDLISSKKIYVGGYPGDHGLDHVVKRPFEGCLEKFQVGSSEKNLNKNLEALGAISGCPKMVARTVSFAAASTGYVAMPNMNIESVLQLSFKFKTVEPSALLFYIANFDQSSTFAVSLLDGTLVVRSRPGGEVQSSEKIQYNDSQWHYVMITKSDRTLSIDIDDNNSFTQNLLEIPNVETSSPMYFGGVPGIYKINLSAAPAVQSFIGCIGDTTVNGQLQDFSKTEDRPGASLTSCQLGSTIAPTVTKPTEEPKPEPAQTTISEKLTTEMFMTTEPPTTEKIIEKSTTEEMPMTEITTKEITEAPTIEAITTTELPTILPVTVPDEGNGAQCALPLMPYNDPEVKDSDGLRFGNMPNSRLEYNQFHKSIKDSFTFSLQFKTTAESGFLYYVGGKNHIDAVSLFMKNGKMHYYFNCGEGAAKLITNNTYNDGEWHTVEFSRVEKDGEMIMDNEETIKASTPAGTRAKSINFKAPFFFGGLTEEIIKLMKHKVDKVTNSFHGCVREFRHEGKLIDQPSLKESVSLCSSKVEDGSFFSMNGGYIQMYDKFRVGLNMEIAMDIRPRSLSGVLLAVHKPDGDFLVLQMVNGTVKFSIDNGAGAITAVHEPSHINHLCDGQWHSIKAVKTKNVIVMSVDGKYTKPVFSVPGISSTDTNDPLYLGGLPEGPLPKAVQTSEQYVGCINGINFDGKKENLLKARAFGDIIFNTCPTI